MTHTGEEAALDRSVDLERIAAEVGAKAAVDGYVEIAPQFHGVQRQYLETVRDNAVAKVEHCQAVAETREHLDLRTKRSWGAPKSVLYPHLDLLRQERLQRDLTIIKRYLAEVDTLVEESGKDVPKPSLSESTYGDYPRGIDLDAAYTQIRHLTCKLELAVLEADSLANTQRARLQTVQEGSEKTRNMNIATKIQALNSVRSELTAWLEESLATCSSVDHAEDTSSAESDNITPEAVRTAYEKYIWARKILLQATSASSPVSQRQTNTPQHLGPGALEAYSGPAIDDKALQFERTHFGQQAQIGIQQVQDYALYGLNAEQERASGLLLRLTDESQLLPQYPILSNLDKLSKLIRQLGTAPTTTTSDKITEQLASWAFAAEAAGTAMSGTLQTHLKEAGLALNEVEIALQDLKLLQGDS